MKPESHLPGPLHVNLHRLEEADLELEEALAPDALDLQAGDELIHLNSPVQVKATVQKLDQALLVQGRVTLMLDCECARCLKPFRQELVLAPWTLHLPLSGEEAVVVDGDFVDLTPLLREDIFLAFPQHPLCTPDCQGLLQKRAGQPAAGEPARGGPSPWAKLDKLNLES
jgi:uncharacterized protein